MASLFFSYSHKDENLRDQLETQLAALKRQGLIEVWHDRRIAAGNEVNGMIDRNLNAASVILLLVSPDFIASDYCYEREMARAMERHESGEARVIPVILRPCDWHGLPFGRLMATPRDGKPITTWPNIDEAFLNIVTAIKDALREVVPQNGPPPKAATPSVLADAPVLPVIRSSNLRVKKYFTDLDKDRFRHDSFAFIAKFFENSLAELVKRNPGHEQIFQRVDTNRFTAAIYWLGEKVCKASLSMGGGGWGGDSLQYAMTDDPDANGINEAVYVRADDQGMHFESMGMQSFGQRDEKLTPQGAAELFWAIFIKPLQPR